MGREILFKAQRTDTKEWVKGCLLIDYVSGQYFIHALGNCLNESDKVGEEGCLKFFAYEVDPGTVCQYTGLTDKNGRKIFEGDIVSCSHSRIKKGEDEQSFMPEHEEYTRNYVVEFVNKGGHCGYRCRNKSIHFTLTSNTIYNHNVRVIGNLLDNPELLNQ